MALKESIKDSLLKGDFDSIINSSEPSKVTRILLSLSYDKSDIVGWRAIEVTGMLTRKVSERDPEFGRNLIRKLLWNIRDEAGGIGWSSPEILGEIVRNDITGYPEIPVILWSFIDEEPLRKGIIWATGRIGEVSPAIMNFAIPFLEKMFKDGDPSIRFYSAWALCKMGISLETDEDIQEYIYEEGIYEERSLKDILRRCNNSTSSVSHAGFQESLITHQYMDIYTDKTYVMERSRVRCPYCGERIDEPDVISMEFGDFLGGRCMCGAIYGYDPSGRALGEVYIDLLALLCNGDYNKAVNIEEGKDYLVKETIYGPLRGFTGGDIRGIYSRRIVFIKMLRR